MADFRKIGKGITGALTKAEEIAKARKAADMAPTARINLPAPNILIPSKLNNVREAVRNMKGNYGARRVERAADEIPNLERMFTEGALGEAFTGDNARGLMTINPADFEKYATPLIARTKSWPGSKAEKENLPTDEYIKYLQQVGGFSDVPYLNLFKDEVGLPTKASIIGHEGRHRNRSLADKGETAALVQVNPRGDLREGMPRRTQEDFIEALKQELDSSNRMVLPEKMFLDDGSLGFDNPIMRKAIQLPDIYAKGGGVHMVDGGKMAKGVMGALNKAKYLASERKRLKLGEILPKEEADENLRKMLEPSKIKERLYHATPEDIKFFKPGGTNPKVSGEAVWLSNDPTKTPAAHNIGSYDNPRQGVNVMPVHVQAKNPMVLDDETMLKWAREVYGEGSSEFPYLMPKKWREEVMKDYDSIVLADPFKRGDSHEIIMFEPEKIKSAIGNRGTYNTDTADITKSKGGVLHMAKAGKVGNVVEGALTALSRAKEIARANKGRELEEAMIKGGSKGLQDAMQGSAVLEKEPTMEAVIRAAERAAAGRKSADVTKATAPMKLSEALGNMNLEGKGKLKITQADRTRVGGGNIGGPMFSGLQQVDPIYENAVWGVGKKGTASAMINQSDENTLWSTVLGSADQLKTNPIVFNKLRKGFTDSMKQGNLSPELEAKINHNLSLTFGEGADIKDPKIWSKANTFEKRAALADAMLGQGIPPSKGGVALGGEKSGNGVIFKPSEILKRETEPMLLHPEHGGDVPTFAVGPRLFTLSGDVKNRPDLHPGFPIILQGEDKGIVFNPLSGKEALPEYVARHKEVKGREPSGYFDWTTGLKGEGLPTQSITEEYLTGLQKIGKKDGGKIEKSKKTDWHRQFHRKMADGGLAWTDKDSSNNFLRVSHKAKGGSADDEPTTKEILAALPEVVMGATKDEAESYKKPRSISDVIYRGVVANNPVSAGVDLMNMGLMGVDAVTGMMGKPTRLASEKPFAGSEHVKDLMKQYGVTTDEERPISETLLGILSPTAAVKGVMEAPKLIQKAGSAIKSGLNSLPKNLPVGMSIEMVGDLTPKEQALAKMREMRPDMKASSDLQKQYDAEMNSKYNRDMPTFEQWKAKRNTKKAHGGLTLVR
jgi:hypothetical protein